MVVIKLPFLYVNQPNQNYHFEACDEIQKKEFSLCHFI